MHVYPGACEGDVIFRDSFSLTLELTTDWLDYLSSKPQDLPDPIPQHQAHMYLSLHPSLPGTPTGPVLGSWCFPPFLTLWGMFAVSWAQLRVYCTNLRICYIPLKSVNFCFRWQSIGLDSTQALPFPRQPNSQFSSIFSSAATIDSPSDARGFEMSLRLKQSVHRTWHLPLPVSSQEFSPRFPSALSLSFTPES